MKYYTIEEIPDLGEVITSLIITRCITYQGSNNTYEVTFTSGRKVFIDMTSGLSLHVGDSIIDYEPVTHKSKFMYVYFDWGQKATIQITGGKEYYDAIMRSKALSRIDI